MWQHVVTYFTSNKIYKCTGHRGTSIRELNQEEMWLCFYLEEKVGVSMISIIVSFPHCFKIMFKKEQSLVTINIGQI